MGLVEISAGSVGLSDYAYDECPPDLFVSFFFFFGGGGDAWRPYAARTQAGTKGEEEQRSAVTLAAVYTCATLLIVFGVWVYSRLSATMFTITRHFVAN